MTDAVTDGQAFSFGGIDVRCLHTPFHTPGHICFHCTAPAAEGAGAASSGPTPGVVFTGDTLFVAGCGRINGRGTAAQMRRALVDVLGSLPRDTQAFVGHEYTAANLRFALAVEPSNAALAALRDRAEAALAAGRPTVPSTIGAELDANPFLRPGSAEVRAFVAKGKGEGALASDEAVLGALRQLKNEFGLGAAAGRR